MLKGKRPTSCESLKRSYWRGGGGGWVLPEALWLFLLCRIFYYAPENGRSSAPGSAPGGWDGSIWRTAPRRADRPALCPAPAGSHGGRSVGAWPRTPTSPSAPPSATTRPCGYGTSPPATACWPCESSRKVTNGPLIFYILYKYIIFYIIIFSFPQCFVLFPGVSSHAIRLLPSGRRRAWACAGLVRTWTGDLLGRIWPGAVIGTLCCRRRRLWMRF